MRTLLVGDSECVDCSFGERAAGKAPNGELMVEVEFVVMEVVGREFSGILFAEISFVVLRDTEDVWDAFGLIVEAVLFAWLAVAGFVRVGLLLSLFSMVERRTLRRLPPR